MTQDVVINVNPIHENTVYINDAVVIDVDFVDAVLISETVNSDYLKKCIDCIIVVLFLGCGMFFLFLCVGGIGFFLTINGGDDAS
jgi:predicted small integral membrane protein